MVTFFLFNNIPLIINKSWVETEEEKERIKKLKGCVGYGIRMYMLGTKVMRVLVNFCYELEAIYYLCYGKITFIFNNYYIGCLSILGTLLHPFFMSFHLTEMLLRYPTLKNILLAVYSPRK